MIPVVAIVGPTAVGKTALSISLAEQFHGEIVSADSMQLYRGLEIASAQPTLEERRGIPHHLMGILSLEQAFSVSAYLPLARSCIQSIWERGNLPIVTGGTGLYLDALLQNITFADQPENTALRETLYQQAQKDQGAALYQELLVVDPKAAAEIHPHNLVRVVRAVECYRLTGKTLTHHKEQSRLHPSPYRTLWIGLTHSDRAKLYQRIDQRVDQMMEQGLLQQVAAVVADQTLCTAGNAIGYKELLPYLRGEASLPDCIARIKQATRHYAKRQLTWFRRNPQIHWIDLATGETVSEVVQQSKKMVENFLTV